MNRRKKGFLFWLLIAVVLALLFRIWYKRSPGMLERYSSYAIYPFIVVHNRVVEPVKHWMFKGYAASELEKSVAALQTERDELMAEAIELRSELRNRADIKEIEESNKPLADSTVCIAQIIAKNFSDDAHYLLIDAGSSKGIMQDMVVVYKQCLVGKVTEVYPWYSKVVALTDRTCKVSACCLQTKTVGMHEGKNNLGSTSLNYVSHLEPIQADDYLISSGEGLVFPRGLGIGQIVACVQDGLYHVIDVKPLVDFKKINYCAVIQRGKSVMSHTVTTTTDQAMQTVQV